MADTTTGHVTLIQKLDAAAKAVRAKYTGPTPDVAVVLGSGLGPFAEVLDDAVMIPYEDVPYMQTSTATSHVGRFVIGRMQDKIVMCMQGRLHGYEGYSSQDVAFPIWLMGHLGIETLITTNAAGAINEAYDVGDFCIMRDHINFTGRNPVVGIEPDELAPRFFGMVEAYDKDLRKLAKKIARERRVRVHEGVYLGLLGPSFETPAEIKAFRRWGADTVAMSVCEEVIAARHIGMRVCGVSFISNMASGVGGGDPLDDDILNVAAKSSIDFCNLISGIVEAM
jgi:purine-nucleoside phosphorylase